MVVWLKFTDGECHVFCDIKALEWGSSGGNNGSLIKNFAYSGFDLDVDRGQGPARLETLVLHVSPFPLYLQDPVTLSKATQLSSLAVPHTKQPEATHPASCSFQRLACSCPWAQGGLQGAQATICWSCHAWAQQRPRLQETSPSFQQLSGWVTSQLCHQPLRGLCFCLSGPSWLPGRGPTVLHHQQAAHIAQPVPMLAKQSRLGGPVSLASVAAHVPHLGTGPQVGWGELLAFTSWGFASLFISL